MREATGIPAEYPGKKIKILYEFVVPTIPEDEPLMPKSRIICSEVLSCSVL